MSHLYKNKYRIKSARRDGYDYTTDGWYFVTICTKNKYPYFGEIVDEKMVLNELGEIADNFWKEIPKHFKNTRVDYYVIMPNHMHGIVVIDNDDDDDDDDDDDGIVETPSVKTPPVETLHCNVSTINVPMNKKQQFMSKISPKPGSLSTIIRSYKSVCTKQINKNHKSEEFAWQSRFHDRIIRDEDELNNKRQYIIDNPEKWEFDRNNPDNSMY